MGNRIGFLFCTSAIAAEPMKKEAAPTDGR